MGQASDLSHSMGSQAGSILSYNQRKWLQRLLLKVGSLHRGSGLDAQSPYLPIETVN
ncbi:MAG: hypothetical protein AAF483_14365 [Planctomycetota bacterium]